MAKEPQYSVHWLMQVWLKKKVLIKKISVNKSIFNIGEREVDEVTIWTLENADNIYWGRIETEIRKICN